MDVQGDFMEQERLERKSQVDQLRLELQALKQVMENLYPGFLALWNEAYEKERLSWDPEAASFDR
ncbi:MAG: hypothetical protein ACO3A2_11285 [Bdellovibrionia bacterium]